MITPTGIASLPAQLTAAQAARRPLRAIGAASAVAARIAVESGFDALWVSGLEISTVLGLPDENVLRPRGFADTVCALTRTAALPVIVDGDNAGGTAATARRFAGDLVRTGAAALCLEDSAYPKVNSCVLHRSQVLAPTRTVTDQLKAMRDAAGADGVAVRRRTASSTSPARHRAWQPLSCLDASPRAETRSASDASHAAFLPERLTSV
ncbi:isocitrate lyase/phosphoenolpyruvate mutase family protein [Streptomyces sp. NPDC059819]|uniref:isocitrate lyase/phosphoenolpyruvate mutase family protein n=1 Tax=Streptomyces sp. NPDC059819 TaxID=3346963 RepID=UPI003664C650